MTKREILQALLDGKKIRNKAWSSIDYVWMVGDEIVNDEGDVCSPDFIYPEHYEIYQEPKKLVKKTMWQAVYTIKGDSCTSVGDSAYDDFESAIDSINGYAEDLSFVGAKKIEVHYET